MGSNPGVIGKNDAHKKSIDTTLIKKGDGEKPREDHRVTVTLWSSRLHTPDNILFNMSIGLTIGWGIAYRYLLLPAIGGRNYPSTPIVSTNRFRLIFAFGFCVWGRYSKSSIDSESSIPIYSFNRFREYEQ